MTTYTTDLETLFSYEYNYTYDYGDEYMYPGYKFERPVYLYIWEILVIVTFFQNLLILSVFMRRKMRSPTNMILCAMAISDSLTGMVTLPTYIMVFQRFDPLRFYDYDTFENQTQKFYDQNSRKISYTYYSNTTNSNQSADDNNVFNIMTVNNVRLTTTVFYEGNIADTTLSLTEYFQPTHPPVDGYVLSKNLCLAFMFSKYFLSKSFHTISIFLTLFLELQRYVSMAFPYQYETRFNKFKIVNIYCIFVYILCPCLHAFHFGSQKAGDGLCQWELSDSCRKDCIYLWTAFVVQHLIPCVTLVTFTGLFIHQLRKGEESFRRVDSDSSQYSRRVHENRRITLVVTVVVVVRLIPEIPYSIYLLYNSVDVTVNMGGGIDLETNRIFHMCYEICLVFSFLANFYIYIIVNKSFRKHMCRMFIEPVRKQMRVTFRFYEFPSWLSSSSNVTRKRTASVKPGEELEMKTIQSNISGKLGKMKNKSRT